MGIMEGPMDVIGSRVPGAMAILKAEPTKGQMNTLYLYSEFFSSGGVYDIQIWFDNEPESWKRAARLADKISWCKGNLYIILQHNGKDPGDCPNIWKEICNWSVQVTPGQAWFDIMEFLRRKNEVLNNC